MNSTNLIIQNLPETFTRKDVLETAKQLDYSFSTANSFFEKALYKGLIQRTSAGEYKKTA